MNFDNKKPIFENIANKFKEYIDLGIYKLNDKLPSVRRIADLYGINPNTIQKSFNILEKEGYIQIIPKKGIYVKKNIDDKNAIDNLEKNIQEEVKRIKECGVTKEKLLEIVEVVYNDRN